MEKATKKDIILQYFRENPPSLKGDIKRACQERGWDYGYVRHILSHNRGSQTHESDLAQVMIPEAVMDRLGLKRGDKLTVSVRGEEIVLRKSLSVTHIDEEGKI